MAKLRLCLLAVAAMLVAAPAASPSDKPDLLRAISHYRAETWHWQRLMGKPRTPSSFSDQTSPKPAYRRWVLQLWQRRAIRAKRAAQRPPHLRHWLCIYRHERHPRQGWRTRTGNGFYGGLQMDIAFQRRYAPWLLRRKGTANRWSPVEQIWVAERGRRVQGWYAWPNTARACGLI